MAVDDHGLEAIRKSSEESKPGDKSDYYVKVREFDPETNTFGAISPAGTLETGELIRLTGGNFESGALLSNIWDTSLVGSGTATVVTGELVLATNGTANSEAAVQAVNRARFVTATFNKAHLAIQNVNFSATDVTRRWGMFDPVTPIISGDGIFFQNTDGNVTLVRRKAGIDVEIVEESDFNGNDTSAGSGVKFVKDENVHIYEIVYNAGSALFFQDRRLVHRMTFLDAVGYETVHLALGAEIVNQNGNTTNNQLKTRGFACSRIGTESARPDRFRIQTAASASIKNSPGTLEKLIITETGGGGASITLYDAAVAGTNEITTIDLTESLITIPFGLDFNFGLSYTSIGINFDVLIIFN